MARLIFDGSNDYLALASSVSIISTDDFSIKWWWPANGSGSDMRILGGATLAASVNSIIALANGDVTIYNDVGGSSTFTSVNTIITEQECEIRRVSGYVGFYINDVLQGTTQASSDAYTMQVVGGNFGSVTPASELEYLLVDINSSPSIDLEPDSSDTSNTGAQPILVDTIAANSATGTGFATDGSAWAIVLKIDSSPTTLTRAGASSNIVVSTPVAAPTGGNTTVQLGGVSGPTLTLGTITGSDPYTIPISAPLPTAIQNQTGLSFYVTVAAEIVTGGTCTLEEELGYDYIDLVDPESTDANSLLYGYTGDAPVTGDQLVFEATTDPSGDTVTVDALGYPTIDPFPTATQNINRYVIQADGTIGTSADYTYEISNTPSAFSFSDTTDATLSTQYQATASITGLTGGAAITVVNGELSTDGGSSWSSSPTTYVDGLTQVRATATSAGTYSTAIDTIVTVNGLSDTFTITTRAANTPIISTQPDNASVVEGGGVTFTVVTDDTAGAHTYQWYKDSVAVSGETSTSYSFTPLLADNGTEYYCVVTRDLATLQSSSASLIVVASANSPVITTQPSSLAVTEGAIAVFTIVTDDALGAHTYQWKKDGIAITLANSTSYAYTPVLGDSGAVFTCDVTRDLITLASDGATLTVNATPTVDFWANQPSPLTRIVTIKQTVLKDADATLHYLANMITPIGNRLISSVAVDPDSALTGLTVTSEGVNTSIITDDNGDTYPIGTAVGLRMSGGTDGERYEVLIRMTLDSGEIDDRTLIVDVIEK